MIFIVAPLAGFLGSYACYACLPDVPLPIGFIWFRFVGKKYIEILHAYVLEEHRKKRVASSILNHIWQQKPDYAILTACSTELSEPVLKKLGFVQTEQGWTLTK